MAANEFIRHRTPGDTEAEARRDDRRYEDERGSARSPESGRGDGDARRGGKLVEAKAGATAREPRARGPRHDDGQRHARCPWLAAESESQCRRDTTPAQKKVPRYRDANACGLRSCNEARSPPCDNDE